MPVLDDRKAEKYCQLRVRGNTQVKAYFEVTGTYHEGNACRYERSNEKILPRIKELNDNALAILGIGKTFVAEQFQDAAAKALRTGEMSAFNGAMDKLGKMAGVFEADNKQKKAEFNFNASPELVDHLSDLGIEIKDE